jgi:hypothetical protein
MARKKRYPTEIVLRVDSLIRKVAEDLRREDDDYAEIGLVNSAIVTGCLSEAREIMRREFDEMVAGYLAARIPIVLPKPSETEETRYLTLPGLNLPVWLAIPREDKGEFGWKFQPDVTPNQLTRVIDHRQKEIDGRITEKQKLAILRDTALEMGCDPNEPIKTVFDGDRSKSPPDRPRPSPLL